MEVRNTERLKPLVRSRHWLVAWLLFLGAIVASFFIHEIGHCIVAWLHGFAAVPTPAKEYLLDPVPISIQYQVALWGIIGSLAALLISALWLFSHPDQTGSALFAGALVGPGFYTLRFVLAGRGHDATEFQEAQAALGLSYSGHAVDWLFAAAFLLAIAFWFLRTRPRLTLRLMGRLAVGTMVALTFLVLLQSLNNAIFDPLFQSKSPIQGHRLANARPVAWSTGMDEFPSLRAATKSTVRAC